MPPFNTRLGGLIARAAQSNTFSPPKTPPVSSVDSEGIATFSAIPTISAVQYQQDVISEASSLPSRLDVPTSMPHNKLRLSFGRVALAKVRRAKSPTTTALGDKLMQQVKERPIAQGVQQRLERARERSGGRP